MDFSELIHKRYSCRYYSPEPIEEDKIRLVLEAARLAPTAANRQPFQIIVIHTEKHDAEDLQKIYPKDWFVQPPYILAICSLPEQAWFRNEYDDQNFSTIDAAIVVDHITLQAADLGLGTCWIGNFDPQAAREYLKLPEYVEPIAFTPLGYPLDEPRAKTRKILEDLIHHDTW